MHIRSSCGLDYQGCSLGEKEEAGIHSYGMSCLNQHCCSLLSPHLTWGELIPKEEGVRDKPLSPDPLLGDSSQYLL